MLCFVFLKTSLEPVVQMVLFITSHEDGTSFLSLRPFINSNSIDCLESFATGHFNLPCAQPTLLVRTVRIQRSGLPPIASCCPDLCSQPRSGSAQETSARSASQRHTLSIRPPGPLLGSLLTEWEWAAPRMRTWGPACHLGRRPQMT